jgi:hypothetical protein
MALDVDVTVCGVTTYTSFAILEGSSLCGLLGIDWLTHNNALIDIVNDCIHLGDETIPFVDVVLTEE